MNGIQRGIEGNVFMFPMILRIRTARLERLNWLNSVMPRQIRGKGLLREDIIHRLHTTKKHGEEKESQVNVKLQ